MKLRVSPRTPFGDWILQSGRSVMSVRDEVRALGPEQERFADKTVRAAIRGPVGPAAACALAQVSGLPEESIRSGRHVIDISALDEGGRATVMSIVNDLKNGATSCAAG